MSASPLSVARKHVLGDLYADCEPITEQVPVYLAEDQSEMLGHVDEALGKYADAFTFHLADDVCKRLSAGQYTYEFDIERSPKTGRVVLRTVFLVARKNYEKPLPARRSAI